MISFIWIYYTRGWLQVRMDENFRPWICTRGRSTSREQRGMDLKLPPASSLPLNCNVLPISALPKTKARLQKKTKCSCKETYHAGGRTPDQQTGLCSEGNASQRSATLDLAVSDTENFLASHADPANIWRGVAMDMNWRSCISKML